jgi:hypothetical protein
VPNAEVVSVAPVERSGFNGYAVAYSEPTLDGPSASGYAVMFNDSDGTLHIANLTIDVPDLDLNTEEDSTNYAQLAQVMGTFSLLSEGQSTDAAADDSAETDTETDAEPEEATEEVTEEADAEATEEDAEEADESDAGADDAEATEEVTEEAAESE